MKGISFVAVLLAWIGSFMNFAIVQVMTAGGPANASEVFATLVYKNAFLYADASYAATLGILLLAAADDSGRTLCARHHAFHPRLRREEDQTARRRRAPVATSFEAPALRNPVA